jgi:hypothetical protein
MKTKTVVGVLLTVVGVVAFAYQSVSYATLGGQRSLGSMHLSTRHEQFIPLLPIFGAIALIVGIALLLVDKSDFKSTATP